MTTLLHKVNPETEDETTAEMPDAEYAERITEVAAFLMFLLGEKERLSHAIRAANQGMDMGFDGEASLNAKRQEIAGIFHHRGEIRCSENLLSGAGMEEGPSMPARLFL